MAPIRAGPNMTSPWEDDCTPPGNFSEGMTNTTCTLSHTYDQVGAMKFVVTTILVYALLGTVTMLFMRIRRRTNNQHKVMDSHDEHVQRYLREGGRLKAEGHRLKLRCEIRKFYSTVPQQEQHEEYYERKPWLRDLTSRQGHPDLQHGCQQGHELHDPIVLCQPLSRETRDRNSAKGSHEEHELQPLCGVLSSREHALHGEANAVPGTKLLSSSGDGVSGCTGMAVAPCGARGPNLNGSPGMKSPHSELQVHKSSIRGKPVELSHVDSNRRTFSDDAPVDSAYRDSPSERVADSESEALPTRDITHPAAVSAPRDKNYLLVHFSAPETEMTSSGQDDVTAGAETEETAGVEVVVQTASPHDQLETDAGTEI